MRYRYSRLTFPKIWDIQCISEFQPKFGFSQYHNLTLSNSIRPITSFTILVQWYFIKFSHYDGIYKNIKLSWQLMPQCGIEKTVLFDFELEYFFLFVFIFSLESILPAEKGPGSPLNFNLKSRWRFHGETHQTVQVWLLTGQSYSVMSQNFR